MRVDIKKDGDWADSDDDLIIIAADSKGIKVTNRGQWMSYKWGSRKKSYLKIHVATVNIETKEILALEVTDEKVHDSKMMKKLVKHVLNNTATAKRRRKNKHHFFIGNGVYDLNANFKFSKDCNIRSITKVRRNSVVSPLNNKIRNREVKHQKEKWKKKNGYGYRWMARETMFSSSKGCLLVNMSLLPGFKT